MLYRREMCNLNDEIGGNNESTYFGISSSIDCR